MKIQHLFLVLFVVLVWGVNFVAVRIALDVLPPLLLCAIRFTLAAFPLVLFLPKPDAPFKFILAYGLLTFAVQFGLLFTGIYLGISPGLAAVILQVQVFFSMALATTFLGERMRAWPVIGALISFIGIGIVAGHTDGQITFTGLMLTLTAALSWATGNLFTKKIHAKSPLSLVVWGNLVSMPFMILASYLIDGPTVILSSLQNLTIPTIVPVLYTVYLATHFGYGAWGYLLNLYPTSYVTPFTLLVCVIGFISSAVILHEPLQGWKMLASIFVVAGLIFNLSEKYIRRLLRFT